MTSKLKINRYSGLVVSIVLAAITYTGIGSLTSMWNPMGWNIYILVIFLLAFTYTSFLMISKTK